MHTPENCQSIQEVRQEVDRIDQTLVNVLSERMDYAKRGAELKQQVPGTDTGSMPGSRLEQMIEARRKWAVTAGLSADLVENIFRHMVAAFLEIEGRHTASKNT